MIESRLLNATHEPLFDDNATPTQVSGVDIDELSETPSPDDFFLYSRIDGSTTVGELCSTSGLGRESTLEALQRLLEVGLIDMPGVEREEASSAPTSSDATSSRRETRRPRTSSSGANDLESSRRGETRGDDEASTGDSASNESTGLDLSHLPVPPSAFEFDDKLLERDDLPIERPKRRELLCLHGQLDEVNYYQFFDIDRDASARDIKHAYFKLSKRYHPDRYFQNDLGPFAEIIEDVFQHVTRGHRILSDPEQRDEYDAQLEEQEIVDDEEDVPTPMNQPSSIDMARKQDASTDIGDDNSDPDKREAAFRVLVNRGTQARQKEQIVQAAEQFRKALRIQRDVEVALEAADMLVEADLRLEQAQLFARAALRIDDKHPDAHLLMARIFDKLEERERALEHYNQVLDIREDEMARRRRNELLDS